MSLLRSHGQNLPPPRTHPRNLRLDVSLVDMAMHVLTRWKRTGRGEALCLAIKAWSSCLELQEFVA